LPIHWPKASSSGGGLPVLKSSHSWSSWVPSAGGGLACSGGGMIGHICPPTGTLSGIVSGAPSPAENML
jgi:hypothetical protein